MGRRTIRWTSHELDVIAQHAAMMYPNAGLVGLMPSTVDQIQKALPPERRRTLLSLQACMKMLRKQLAPFYHNALIQNKAHIEVETKPPAPKVDQLSDLLSALITEAVEKVFEKHMEELRRLVAATPVKAFGESVSRGMYQSVSQEAPRPSLLVVGPIGSQKFLIQEEFAKEARLHFTEPGAMRGLNLSCYDGAVVWTKFCTHAQSDMVKNNVAHIHWANGGIESIKEQIRAYLTKAC